MLTHITKSARSLIGANILTAASTLLFGWSLPQLLLAYWLENLAIGLLNIAKMIVIGLRSTPQPYKGETVSRGQHLAFTIFSVPFFIVHYGGFMAGHGVFLYFLFEVDFTDIPNVLLVFIPLLAHHIYSFFINFIGKKEYEGKMSVTQMISPYARITVLHVTILFGGAVLMVFDAGIVGLLILMIGKIVLDTGLHLRSHTKAQRSHAAA